MDRYLLLINHRRPKANPRDYHLNDKVFTISAHDRAGLQMSSGQQAQSATKNSVTFNNNASDADHAMIF